MPSSGSNPSWRSHSGTQRGWAKALTFKTALCSLRESGHLVFPGCDGISLQPAETSQTTFNPCANVYKSAEVNGVTYLEACPSLRICSDLWGASIFPVNLKDVQGELGVMLLQGAVSEETNRSALDL